jgi:hypothetical protein
MKRFTLSILLAAVTAAPSFAQCTEQSLAGSGFLNLFGASVDIDGDTMVIGQTQMSTPGEAFIYQRTSPGAAWVQVASLASANDTEMGRAVSVSGTLAAIGSWGDGVIDGQVYIADFSDLGGVGLQVQTLTSHLTPADRGGYGFSVSIDGDRLVVGEPFSYNNAGRVHIYDRQPDGSWLLDTRFFPNHPFNDDHDLFGYAVELDGDFFISGSPGNLFPQGNGAGGLIIEDKNGVWDANAIWFGGYAYGSVVALDGDHAYMGGTQDGDFLVYNGTAYQLDTALQVAGVTSAAISSGAAMLGLREDDTMGVDAGIALVYRYDGTDWTDTGLGFAPTDVAAGNYFGHELAMDGLTVAATSRFGGAAGGEVYSYERQGFGLCADVASSLAGTGGLSPKLTGAGGTVVGGPVSLTLTDALPNSTGFLFLGFSAINAPFLGGVLVPSPDVTIAITTDATGGVHLSSPYPPGGASNVPLWSQAWINDPGAPVDVSASNTPVILSL